MSKLENAEPQAVKSSRPMRERFLFALFPCGLFSFMYFFFAPTELVYANEEYIQVSILRSTPYFLLSFVLVTLVLALALSLCRGVCYDALSKLILGLSVASYIQANFLNTGFNYLDGRFISWSEYANMASVNLLIWAAMLAAVFLLAALVKTRWKTVCGGICVLLVIMQTAGLVALYADSASSERISDDEGGLYLSTAQQFDISKNENVIVFILDACSNRALQNMLAVYDDALEGFSDFTYFKNCAPSYYGTFPEVMVLLTGNDSYDSSRPWREYFDSSWSSAKCEDFYTLLADKGYERNVFDSEMYVSYKYQLVDGRIDNALPKSVRSDSPIDVKKLYTKIEALTLYRYFPIAMKACYWSSDEDYKDITKVNAERWSCVESEWFSGLQQNGLNVKDENVFSVYHFEGAHSPYLNNEHGEPVERHSDRNKSLCGSFFIIADYLQRLKDIGAYDSSTIIVMGDHGDYTFTDSTASSSAIFMIKRRNETHDEMAVSNAPITHLEFIPTVTAEIEPSAAAGETVFSIKEDAVRDRTLFRWNKTDKLSPDTFDSLYKFIVPADINDLNDLMLPDEILPLYDSFY